jgi:2-dehydro-3-deoxyphosphooctonate aldolase (KDO 8-P synthase)
VTKEVRIDTISMGGNHPFVFIGGPCVIEDEAMVLSLARAIKEITASLAIPFIFKTSYDKANRSALSSYRGPGLKKGLEIIEKIKGDLHIPVVSDVHRFEEIEPAARVLDMLQVPAFLSRQTDFIIKVAETGKAVNIKKGQFMSPQEVKNLIAKAASTGNHRILVTERGFSFGYNNLVVDMRALPIMRSFGYPVVFDASHSVQLPGGLGTASGGERQFAACLARAAAAAGIDALFMEVHPDPERARCDGPNMFALESLAPLLKQIQSIDALVRSGMVPSGQA